MSSAPTTISDSETTAPVQTETETRDPSQGTHPDHPQTTSNAPEPKDQGTPEEPNQREPSKGTLPGTDDIVAQIQKPADLQKSGVLPDEEFTLAKEKLLGVYIKETRFQPAGSGSPSKISYSAIGVRVYQEVPVIWKYPHPVSPDLFLRGHPPV